jgi:hypothetical protein
MSYRDEKDDKPAPKPTPKTPAPEAPSALPEGYVPQPYPKMVYHPDGREKVVQNELDEDTAEAEGFTLDAPPPPPEAKPV